ncbi:SixA phosphatase family protein [Pseudofulvibacter geojedonensis]|uniref:SixA phosphatase family protein n=1 Tax=Pseudofulvibacter geojedonensis TaxID=1123758 RepID=A0ABW3I171_9FLAO
MKIKTYIAFIILTLGLQHVMNAQENDEIFTIYLVRHAEKELSVKNPPLTECGQQRAKSLSTFLKEVNLDAIYSTDYVRTQSTAKPTATIKGLDIKSYNPRKLKDFASLLLYRKEDALVVGHSNTTGVLAGILVNEKIGAFNETIYNRIYQVVVYKDTGRLHIFHTDFTCN